MQKKQTVILFILTFSYKPYRNNAIISNYNLIGEGKNEYYSEME